MLDLKLVIGEKITPLILSSSVLTQQLAWASSLLITTLWDVVLLIILAPYVSSV